MIYCGEGVAFGTVMDEFEVMTDYIVKNTHISFTVGSVAVY